ncbi:hypothetical protein EYF80_017122 [Liparis tanakae]|uniref:Uncharacterized protein n=1 Tax=Liparis tanakae TaxID=230148 RepID=A0A4Z2I621_9TELE|nr:hypothetical protein EYF80_017122 [Liparis tanakae]
MATEHKGTASALMIWICRDGQRSRFRAGPEIWMQSFQLDTGPEYTRKKKKNRRKKNRQHRPTLTDNFPLAIITSQSQENCPSKQSISSASEGSAVQH